jgi:hypothetical protein
MNARAGMLTKLVGNGINVQMCEYADEERGNVILSL